MIFPGPTGSRAAAGRELVDAASVGVDNRTGLSIRAGIQRVSDAIAVRVGFTAHSSEMALGNAFNFRNDDRV